MDILRLNIDRYINGMFTLAEDLERLPELKEQYKNLLLGNFSEFSDAIKEGRKHVDSEDYKAKARLQEKRIKELEGALLLMEHAVLKLPSKDFRYWFNIYRESNLESDIERINDKLSISALPEIEFYEKELLELLNKYPLHFGHEYANGIFFIPLELSPVSPFLRDVNTIDFAKYLDERITTLRTMPITRENRLKWIGKPAQLAYLIGELTQKGYIDAPTQKDGEINYTALAKQVMNSFDAKTTLATIAKGLNPDSESGQIKGEKKEKFVIPHIKQIS